MEQTQYEDQVLDDAGLAEHLQIKGGSLQAIKKRFQRLRALPKNNPKHLPHFEVGNQVRYRMSAITKWKKTNEKHIGHFWSSLYEIDPSEIDPDPLLDWLEDPYL